MAESLTTDAFINALRRFIARRGQVRMIRSDNGSNFTGAEKELGQAIKEWNQSRIESFLLQQGITWQFNAPGASHHGGAWERLIRATRRVMVGLTREQMLNDDGLNTLFAEAESVLNGRPLTRCSTDPNDFSCLTPNHLLLKDQQSLPPGIFSSHDNYVRRRWRQVQYLSNLFWKRWVREYLTLLQVRQKWLLPQRSVQVGDLVLIVDPNAPRGSRLFGKVEETFPDRNGRVRNASIRTKSLWRMATVKTSHLHRLFTFRDAPQWRLVYVLRVLLVSPGAGAVYCFTKFSRACAKTLSHIPSKLAIILTVS